MRKAIVNQSPPSPAAAPGGIASLRQLGKALGVSAKTVCQYRRRGDWPRAVPKSPPWTTQHVALLNAWRSGALREDRDAAPSKAKPPAKTKAPAKTNQKPKKPSAPANSLDEQIEELEQEVGSGDELSEEELENVEPRLKLERLKHIKVQRLKLEAKLVDRDLLEGGIIAITRLFVRELEALPTAMALQLADKQPDQVEKILGDWVHNTRQRLAGEESLQLQAMAAAKG